MDLQNAVSVFIRLGFASKKETSDTDELHSSWRVDPSDQEPSPPYLAAQELEVGFSDLVMENLSGRNSAGTSNKSSSTSVSSTFPELSNSGEYFCSVLI